MLFYETFCCLVHLPVFHKTQTLYFELVDTYIPFFLPLFLGSDIQYTLFTNQVESAVIAICCALYYSFIHEVVIVAHSNIQFPCFSSTMAFSTCFFHSKVLLFCLFDMILVLLILSNVLVFSLRSSFYAYFLFF